MSGGDWKYPTKNPLIRAASRGASASVAYGQAGWVSQCYTLLAFDYRLTDLY